jgi:ABC-2 type transport system ATP-binding protein
VPVYAHKTGETKPMIEMENLTKTFGKVEAVRDLTLTVPEGELFCFLGPNGAGTTTTIKMLTGLLKPTSGAMRIAGIDITKDPVSAKKIIGYIPDMPFLYERLTAEEFFRFIGDLYDVSAERIENDLEESFDLFGIADYRNILIADMSHGMRQRLIYCASFLHDPTVFFIDEPLIGLDPFTIRMIKNLLVAKTRAGMTILLTTHILALAEDIADRIGIILRGDLIAVGSLDELREKSNIRGNLEEVFLALTGAGDTSLFAAGMEA